MRLIDIRSFPRLTLKEFFGGDIPTRYAILSHRWGQPQDEIMFHEMLHGHDMHSREKRWQKIQDFCKHARDDGFEFAWVDTCCINKESSSELTEALNSMFQW